MGALAAILEEGRRDPEWAAPTKTCTASSSVSSWSASATPAAAHRPLAQRQQVPLDLRLYLLAAKIPVLQRAVAEVVAALADRAAHAGEALMPSYTHLRKAQPVLVAHFFSHAAALRRDYDRLAAAMHEADACPLGSGSVAGTSYAVDAAALAKRLGFTRVVANSIDASSDRDFVSAFLHAVALCMVHLSRLAEDHDLHRRGARVLRAGRRLGHGQHDAAEEEPGPARALRQDRTGHRPIDRLARHHEGAAHRQQQDLQEDKEAVFESDTRLRSRCARPTPWCRS